MLHLELLIYYPFSTNMSMTRCVLSRSGFLGNKVFWLAARCSFILLWSFKGEDYFSSHLIYSWQVTYFLPLYHIIFTIQYKYFQLTIHTCNQEFSLQILYFDLLTFIFALWFTIQFILPKILLLVILHLISGFIFLNF